MMHVKAAQLEYHMIEWNKCQTTSLCGLRREAVSALSEGPPLEDVRVLHRLWAAVASR